jgi:hypothetical protein
MSEIEQGCGFRIALACAHLGSIGFNAHLGRVNLTMPGR